MFPQHSMPEKIKILTEATELAIERGWQGQLREDHWCFHDSPFLGRPTMCFKMAEGYTLHIDYAAVIFNREYAAALWGKTWKEGQVLPSGSIYPDLTGKVATTYVKLSPWEHHLKQMVTSNDHFGYLEANR